MEISTGLGRRGACLSQAVFLENPVKEIRFVERNVYEMVNMCKQLDICGGSTDLGVVSK